MTFELIFDKAALHVAVENENLDMVRHLLERVDIDVDSKSI